MKLKDNEFILNNEVVDIEGLSNGIVLKVVEPDKGDELQASILIKGKVPELAAMFEMLVESDEVLSEIVSLYLKKIMFKEDVDYGINALTKSGEA